MEGDRDDGSCNGSLPGWDGEELQYTDGWVTNWAGDSPKDPDKEAGAAVGTMMADTMSAKEKQARRNFYANFTERALAKCGDYSEEKNLIEQDDVDRVEHEHILAWRAWVDLRHRVPKASARLFCCPWAGGNSLMFERWSEELPGVEVVPLLLPGRLTRARENAVTNLSDIVTMVVEAICGLHLLTHEDIPYLIYGHDFGALVAFEICRRVQDEFPMKALIVSSMSCPQMVHGREKMTSLCQVSPEGEILHAKNAEFESAMLRRGPPLPPELLENKGLMEIFTPLWFADLSAVDTYEYKSGTLLECPIYSLGGIKDGEQDMSKWAMESSSGSSETTMFPGGSFFLLDRDNEVGAVETGLMFPCYLEKDGGPGLRCSVGRVLRREQLQKSNRRSLDKPCTCVYVEQHVTDPRTTKTVSEQFDVDGHSATKSVSEKPRHGQYGIFMWRNGLDRTGRCGSYPPTKLAQTRRSTAAVASYNLTLYVSVVHSYRSKFCGS